MTRRAKRIGIPLFLALTAGCSGGGGGTGGVPAPTVVASPTASPTATPVAKQTLVAGTATIFIPEKSQPASTTIRPKGTTYRGHTRRPLWVSPSTQSVSINAVAPDGFAGYVITAVPANSPNCTAVTGGRTCTLGFNAPPGVDSIQIYAWDQTDAYNGAPVAKAVVNGVNIAAQGNNTFTFTLGGIVGEPIVLAPTSFSVTQATPQDLTLTITGEDYDFNPITKYDAPLAITQTDTTGTFTLSATSIADSSVTPSITIHYNGGTAPTTITVATTSTETANDYGPQSTSITITPSPLLGAYFDTTTGINVYSTTSGQLLGSFASSFGSPSSFAMDNSGNVYLSNANGAIARFAIGGNTSTATYTPTPGSTVAYWLQVTPAGTLLGTGWQYATGITVDEWDAGKTGPPSRTLVRSGNPFEFPAIASDGTLYVPYVGARAGNALIDTVAPGTTTVTGTITLPSGFAVEDDAVGPDGTLYVAENNGGQDALLGLYVYPTDSNSYRVTTGAPQPTGVDVDDAGDVYVVNSNSPLGNADGSDDTLHLYTEFSPGAATILRQVSSGFSNAQSLTVSGDGTQSYLVDLKTTNANPALVKIESSATSATTVADIAGAQFLGGQVVLYDGTRAKAIRTGGAHGGFAGPGRFSRLRYQ